MFNKRISLILTTAVCGLALTPIAFGFKPIGSDALMGRDKNPGEEGGSRTKGSLSNLTYEYLT